MACHDITVPVPVAEEGILSHTDMLLEVTNGRDTSSLTPSKFNAAAGTGGQKNGGL